MPAPVFQMPQVIFLPFLSVRSRKYGKSPDIQSCHPVQAPDCKQAPSEACIPSISSGEVSRRTSTTLSLRLFAFALVSEIPFDLALSDRILEFGAQNVFFTLFLGLLSTALIKCVMEKQGWDMPLKLSLSVLIGIAAIWAAYFLKTDYSGMGILLILIFYVFRSDRVRACVVGYISMMWECLCFPAFICIYFYNGKKGNGNKWFFYLFYPVHLLLLYALRIVIR